MAISKAKVMKGAAIAQGIKQRGMQEGAQAVMQKLARPPMPPAGGPAPMPAPSGAPPMPAPGGAPAMKKGGKVKKCARGGGIEIRGKTKGKFV
jgi:hypothetical protein